jgi:hypothetical protein
MGNPCRCLAASLVSAKHCADQQQHKCGRLRDVIAIGNQNVIVDRAVGRGSHRIGQGDPHVPDLVGRMGAAFGIEVTPDRHTGGIERESRRRAIGFVELFCGNCFHGAGHRLCRNHTNERVNQAAGLLADWLAAGSASSWIQRAATPATVGSLVEAAKALSGSVPFDSSSDCKAWIARRALC